MITHENRSAIGNVLYNISKIGNDYYSNGNKHRDKKKKVSFVEGHLHSD